MLTRILTILLLAPPFLWCVYKGGWVLAALLAPISVLCLREFHELNDVPEPDLVEQALAALLPLAAMCGPVGVLAALSLAIARMALPLGFPPVEVERVRRSQVALSGLVLYCLPFGLFQCLRSGPEGLAVVASILGLIWIQDSAAYLCGRAFGRHKLSPEVSPKKTWEGTVGGFLVALPLAQHLFMTLGGTWTGVGLPAEWIGWALLGITAAAAQLGDLVESGMKRAAGVKDSGQLFPGHGGALDRFDAFALAVLVFSAALLASSS